MQNLNWEYGGVQYKRKFKAIEAAGRDIYNVTCNAFSNEFTSYDFTKEPVQTLESLVTQRCFQLRDKYPYIKLWFSGGTDTTTVLNSFLRNNIYIDEIVVYSQSLTNNFDHIGNYELNKFTLPYLENLSKHLTKTKFTTYWVGYDDYRKLLNDKWFEKKNNLDIRTMFAPRIRGNNYCNIYGDLSPEVVKIKDRYYDIQWDTTNITDYVHRNVELFYTTSDLPQLHAKQCHVVKNHLIKTGDSRDPKHVARDLVRDTPVAQEHPTMIKEQTQVSSNFTTKKAKAMMREDPNKDLMDRYKFILGTTLNNTSILKLNIGCKVLELNLGA